MKRHGMVRLLYAIAIVYLVAWAILFGPGFARDPGLDTGGTLLIFATFIAVLIISLASTQRQQGQRTQRWRLCAVGIAFAIMGLAFLVAGEYVGEADWASRYVACGGVIAGIAWLLVGCMGATAPAEGSEGSDTP